MFSQKLKKVSNPETVKQEAENIKIMNPLVECRYSKDGRIDRLLQYKCNKDGLINQLVQYKLNTDRKIDGLKPFDMI
jgi:hypothetical protein